MTAASSKAYRGEELLPCPFCGDAPTYTAYPGGVWHSVQCADGECPGFAGTRHRFSADDAIRDWNRRAHLATPAANRPGEAGREEAPPNSLPSYGECALRVGNSKFIDKRVAEGGYGNEYGVPVASELHKFIHEYDDADPYRSAWFLHRLERLLDETRTLASTPQPGMVTVPREDDGMKSAMFVIRSLIAALTYPVPPTLQQWAEIRVAAQEQLIAIDAALRSGGREASGE